MIELYRPTHEPHYRLYFPFKTFVHLAAIRLLVVSWPVYFKLSLFNVIGHIETQHATCPGFVQHHHTPKSELSVGLPAK